MLRPYRFGCKLIGVYRIVGYAARVVNQMMRSGLALTILSSIGIERWYISIRTLATFGHHLQFVESTFARIPGHAGVCWQK